MHVIRNTCSCEQIYLEKEYSDLSENFDFKCISQNDFVSVYKRVHRRRRKEVEKKKWDLFLARKAEEENKKNIKSKPKSYIDPPKHCAICYHSECCNLNEPREPKPNCLPTNGHNINESFQSFLNEILNRSPYEKENTLIDTNFLNNTEWKEKVDQNIVSPLKRHSPVNNHRPRIIPFKKSESSIALESIYVDPLSVSSDFKKIEMLRLKMVPLLKNIHTLIINGPNINDSEDAERIKLRSSEFSSRFKRNYLYQVQCHVSNIEKILNDKQKVIFKEILTQKLLLVHQSFVQTLQIIEKHLPKITVDAIFNLFNDFFMFVIEVSKKFKAIFKLNPDEAVDNVIVHCEQIMDAMIDLVKIIKPKKKIEEKKMKVKDPLWMYSNKNSWVNKATQMAKVRFGQKNRRKIKINKDIPQSDDKSSNSSSKCNIASGLVNDRIKLKLRKRENIPEDEIETMVQMTELNESDNSEFIDGHLQLDAVPTLYEVSVSDDTNLSN